MDGFVRVQRAWEARLPPDIVIICLPNPTATTGPTFHFFFSFKKKREITTIPFICGHALHRLSDHHTRADNAADAVSHELVQYYFLSVR